MQGLSGLGSPMTPGGNKDEKQSRWSTLVKLFSPATSIQSPPLPLSQSFKAISPPILPLTPPDSEPSTPTPSSSASRSPASNPESPSDGPRLFNHPLHGLDYELERSKTVDLLGHADLLLQNKDPNKQIVIDDHSGLALREKNRFSNRQEKQIVAINIILKSINKAIYLRLYEFHYPSPESVTKIIKIADILNNITNHPSHVELANRDLELKNQMIKTHINFHYKPFLAECETNTIFLKSTRDTRLDILAAMLRFQLVEIEKIKKTLLKNIDSLKHVDQEIIDNIINRLCLNHILKQREDISKLDELLFKKSDVLLCFNGEAVVSLSTFMAECDEGFEGYLELFEQMTEMDPKKQLPIVHYYITSAPNSASIPRITALPQLAPSLTGDFRHRLLVMVKQPQPYAYLDTFNEMMKEPNRAMAPLRGGMVCMIQSLAIRACNIIATKETKRGISIEIKQPFLIEIDSSTPSEGWAEALKKIAVHL